ncbi:hypothetical protein BpHYR1_002323 [Brachionus plicatilis]|uniref:Uncharacterized protein n=1 Tax=Brachionus plicatilis TaxID=10195 RepID=A0A3M7SY83_BRAPC|nr:hypothetical protein BpHYR1_002323 [Brachionus plicatilis]
MYQISSYKVTCIVGYHANHENAIRFQISIRETLLLIHCLDLDGKHLLIQTPISTTFQNSTNKYQNHMPIIYSLGKYFELVTVQPCPDNKLYKKSYPKYQKLFPNNYIISEIASKTRHNSGRYSKKSVIFSLCFIASTIINILIFGSRNDPLTCNAELLQPKFWIKNLKFFKNEALYTLINTKSEMFNPALSDTVRQKIRGM